MSMASLAMIGAGLPSGFLFGTGYGAGVRFGYEDVYPYLKGNMSQIANLLQIPFASSGFKLASGVTEAQGSGVGMLTPPSTQGGGMGLQAPSTATTQAHGLSTGEVQWLRQKFSDPRITGLDVGGAGHVIVKRQGKDIHVYKGHGNYSNLYESLVGLLR